MPLRFIEFKHFSIAMAGVLALMLSGCAADPNSLASDDDDDTITDTSTSDPVAHFRITFTQTNFYSLISPNSFFCAGDAKTYYDARVFDTDGTIKKFSDNTSNTDETQRPNFIKNVSIDLTDSNFDSPENDAYSCALSSTNISTSNCSTFDATTDIIENIYDTTPYRSTSHYTLMDPSCIGAGPIFTVDNEISKKLAGGVDIDIERTQLGATENLLLHLKYYPFSVHQTDPASANWDPTEQAYFRIHLMSTGFTNAGLQQLHQPRYLNFSDEEQYPRVVSTLSTFAPPNGIVREEQFLIPLGIDSAGGSQIDRIRIERVSGSGILIEAAVFRLGVLNST